MRFGAVSQPIPAVGNPESSSVLRQRLVCYPSVRLTPYYFPAALSPLLHRAIPWKRISIPCGAVVIRLNDRSRCRAWRRRDKLFLCSGVMDKPRPIGDATFRITIPGDGFAWEI